MPGRPVRMSVRLQLLSGEVQCTALHAVLLGVFILTLFKKVGDILMASAYPSVRPYLLLNRWTKCNAVHERI